MAEPNTYPCTYCKDVFTKKYEHKKHIIRHENPNSLHYCEICDFYTTQKKNLEVHMGKHTGEKKHRCPDMVYRRGSHGSSPHTQAEPCTYKTNDPAALNKHRQKKHGYVPPPNRSHRKTTSTFSAPNFQEMGNRTIPKRFHPYQRPATFSPPSRPPSLVQSIVTSSSSSDGPETASVCSESLEGASPAILGWQGDLDVYGLSLASDRPDLSCIASTCGSSANTNSQVTTCIAPEGYHLPAYGRHVTSFSPSQSTVAGSSDSSGPMRSSPLEDSSPAMRQRGLDVHGRSSVSDRLDLSYNISTCRSPTSITTSAITFTVPQDNAKLGTRAVCDPTFDPNWLAKYEASYSLFDMNQLPGSSITASAFTTYSDVPGSKVQTGHIGSPRPDWTINSGIEGCGFGQTLQEIDEELTRLNALTSLI